MPRSPRVEIPGGIYHITARGNRKQSIFVEANDRVFWLWCLNKIAAESEWQIFNYVQMGNHFHFLTRITKSNLSHGMQCLNGLYGQFFNHSHGETGHLFQGRFHSRMVETEAHLLECVRYDDLNPVRAGLVDHPVDWRWSSFRATVGLAPRPDFLLNEWVLAHFGAEPEMARQRYFEFVVGRLEQGEAA